MAHKGRAAFQSCRIRADQTERAAAAAVEGVEAPISGAASSEEDEDDAVDEPKVCVGVAATTGSGMVAPARLGMAVAVATAELAGVDATLGQQGGRPRRRRRKPGKQGRGNKTDNSRRDRRKQRKRTWRGHGKPNVSAGSGSGELGKHAGEPPGYLA